MSSAAIVIPELSFLRQQLAATPTLTVTQWEVAAGALLAQWATVPQAEWVSDSVRDCLTQANGVRLAWVGHAGEGAAKAEQPPFTGSVQVLDAEGIYQDWKGFVYFAGDDPQQDGWRQTFKLVDMISHGAPAAVGLFHTARRSPQLYYYKFDGIPLPLEVDLPGYLELLRYSWGGENWQQVLLELRYSPQRPYVPASDETADYADAMQSLVPEFDLQALAACFDRVRLPAEVTSQQPSYEAPTGVSTGSPAEIEVLHHIGPAFRPEAPRAAALTDLLHQQLAAIPTITVTEWAEEPGTSEAEWHTVPHTDWVPATLRGLSYQLTQLALRWHTGVAGAAQISGQAVFICSPEAFTTSWEGTLYFNYQQAPEDAWRREFIPVDLASSRLTVGLYHTARPDPQLYVYDHQSAGRPLPLGLDAWGYLELLRYSWGGHNWQLVLLEAAASAQRPYVPARAETQAYVTAMQHFTPAFDIQALIACFDRVRRAA